ncbi:type II secretion system protein [bacterium]|nr:type II secretion system protein [bacterium]
MINEGKLETTCHDAETLKRVQGDMESCYNTLAPCGRGQGEGSKSLHKTLSRICKFAFCSLTNSTLSQRERVKSRVDFSLPGKSDCHAHSVPLEMTKKKQSPLLFPPLTRGVKTTAFTLAEVLITLGIIGTVAALTMPALMH